MKGGLSSDNREVAVRWSMSRSWQEPAAAGYDPWAPVV
jgi:hypothetical protein